MSEPVTRVEVGRRDEGKRLDRFLHERIPGLSRSRIQAAIRERVELSWGVRPRPATPVRGGGEVRIAHRRVDETPLDLEIPILVSRPGWLAVDKPAHVPVHPVNQVLENSLIRILRRQVAEPALRLVHRLDSETTGVLLVARDAAAARELSRSFLEGRVHKEYLALVAGDVRPEAGRIDLPIGPARQSRVWTRLEAGHGKPASTAWRVEARFGSATLLRLYPATGRRHQLRVHLAALGHPILGDVLYGRTDEEYLALVRGDPASRDGTGAARHLLHCARLVFPDPSAPARIEVEAPLPSDFAAHTARLAAAAR